jgi:hypothetical protein
VKRLLPLLFLATACTTSVEDPPSGCTSISQCVIGQVCNASGQCVPEPPNTGWVVVLAGCGVDEDGLDRDPNDDAGGKGTSGGSSGSPGGTGGVIGTTGGTGGTTGGQVEAQVERAVPPGLQVVWVAARAERVVQSAEAQVQPAAQPAQGTPRVEQVATAARRATGRCPRRWYP